MSVEQTELEDFAHLNSLGVSFLSAHLELVRL